MRDEYDCIVVGAGPGGSRAAYFAAKNGLRTLLLEKDRDIGVPVRCAEGVGEKSLAQEVEIRSEWVSTVIRGVVLVAPNGREVVLEEDGARGLVLDRKRFDFDLAAMAVEQGAEVQTKAYVFGLLRENGRTTGVRVKQVGRVRDVRAKIVIGADGVESRIGRFAGLHTALKLKDLESCVQVTAGNLRLDANYAQLYLGSEVAPGGYAWVFPKSETTANIGIGILGKFARQRSALRYLEAFLARRFPGAAILTTVAGGVPVAATLSRIVADGLMLVGDAAHQVNPLTGGGIVPAMRAGAIAGQVAAEAFQHGDVSASFLSRYADRWQKELGAHHQRMDRIKEGVLRLRDEDFNRLAEVSAELEPEQRTLAAILKRALIRKPRLLLDVARAFVG